MLDLVVVVPGKSTNLEKQIDQLRSVIWTLEEDQVTVIHEILILGTFFWDTLNEKSLTERSVRDFCGENEIRTRETL